MCAPPFVFLSFRKWESINVRHESRFWGCRPRVAAARRHRLRLFPTGAAAGGRWRYGHWVSICIWWMGGWVGNRACDTAACAYTVCLNPKPCLRHGDMCVYSVHTGKPVYRIHRQTSRSPCGIHHTRAHTYIHTHTHSAPAAARLGADYAAFKKSLLSEGLDSSALYRKFSLYYCLLTYYCRKCLLSEGVIPLRFIVTCVYVLVRVRVI